MPRSARGRTKGNELGISPCCAAVVGFRETGFVLRSGSSMTYPILHEWPLPDHFRDVRWDRRFDPR